MYYIIYFISSFVVLCNEISLICRPQSIITGTENPRSKNTKTKKSGNPLINLLKTSKDVTPSSLLLLDEELSSLYPRPCITKNVIVIIAI